MRFIRFLHRDRLMRYAGCRIIDDNSLMLRFRLFLLSLNHFPAERHDDLLRPEIIVPEQYRLTSPDGQGLTVFNQYPRSSR